MFDHSTNSKEITSVEEIHRGVTVKFLEWFPMTKIATYQRRSEKNILAHMEVIRYVCLCFNDFKFENQYIQKTT